MGHNDTLAIGALLRRHGFHFSRSMGQNFLIDPDIPAAIAESSQAEEKNGVLEIGPGIGALSHELCKRAGKVVAVELDRTLLPILSETMANFSNFEVVNADILKTDIPALVREKLDGLTPIVCANLPYNITTPALTALIESKCFGSITVLVQKEVAERLCAKPGTAAYGAFSVFMQYHTEPALLFEVAKECFEPVPKVTSAVVRAVVRGKPPVETADEAFFFKTVYAAFALRRKTLVNSLMTAFGTHLTKERLTQAVTSCGLDANIRGERLGLAEFAALSGAISAALAEKA
ncbi:MAG: 16S rRNA (adenine(1518)-N(6)/adenine(1519)-N(6))-dimethyltransferase RsmA [Oscillospiraceae bacterium]|nr:16S rRNA (adenine(1518)-N(6)/adenine(1519)-N(6))-dimethyltransferase RsmA [Oscillospiraceae bacterium]